MHTPSPPRVVSPPWPPPRRRTRRLLLGASLIIGSLALAARPSLARAQLTVTYANPEMLDPARCVADCFEVTHAYTMPAYVSRDVPRAPTLLYRSGRAKPMVTVTVSATDSGMPAGGKFLLQVHRGDGVYLNWTHGTENLMFEPTNGGASPTQLSGQLDASTWGTGRHHLAVIVSTMDAAGNQLRWQIVYLGALVVDGRNSPFGAGVGLVGYQQVYGQSNGMLVVDGSGQASFFYSATPCNVASESQQRTGAA